MRKDAKQRQSNGGTANIARVQSYHQYRQDGRRGSANYAFNGFGENLYYTSDRTIKLDADFRRPDGKPLKGYGLEIECVSSIPNQTALAELLDKVIFDIFPKHLYKMQNDSSLGGASNAECITQVMTREFIRNHYPEFKRMYDEYFPAFGIKADTSCGMHTNISLACFGASEKTQSECVKKLYYIINHHFHEMCIMLKRDTNRTSYCSRMRGDKDYCKSLDLSNQCSSHGVAFNLGHYAEGRIEIRLVGNQTKYAEFRNTMETIFFLVDAVKRLSWADCDDLVKIFSGCNQHVFDRFTLLRRAGLAAEAQIEALEATKQEVDFR